jgi:adenosylhomocysteine nucleosidase
MHPKGSRSALPHLAAALAVLLLGASALPGAEDRTAAVTGIIGATDGETRLIREEMRGVQEVRILGIRFLTGTLRKRHVVVAQAGVGKVNAAMITTLVIEHFSPREIIFTGIAGRLNPALKPGDVVVGTNLAYHDLGDYTPEGFVPWGVENPADGKRNPVFFAADPALIAVVERASRLVSLSSPDGSDPAVKPLVVKGIIATGDAFIASQGKRTDIRTRFQADAVEMEGAAGAQICHQNGVPFVAIRGISDNADEHATHAVQPFFETAVRNSACLAMKTVELLAGQEKGMQSPAEDSKTRTQSR